jgi:hypothetical protein
MLCSNNSETPEHRHQRLFFMRKLKAKILNERVNQFISDVTKSSIFKDSEKKVILNQFTFNPKVGEKSVSHCPDSSLSREENIRLISK